MYNSSLSCFDYCSEYELEKYGIVSTRESMQNKVVSLQEQGFC